MLPDWPETKEKIAEAFVRVIRSETRARLGLLAHFPQTVAHEGDRMVISRADGSRDEQEFTRVGASLEIAEEDFAGLPIPQMLERLVTVAEQLARGRSEHAFSALGAACEETGNVVDAGGGPLTAELVLKAWETLEMDFREDGTPRIPTMVVNPAQGEVLRRELARLDSDPELRRKADEIIRRQREQWLAREADRTLVG